MSWNDGYERRKFKARQKKQAEQYRELGMTEEQIKVLYEFDMAQYRSDRRYHEHTQAFLPDDFDKNEDDDEKLSIFEKFKDDLTTTIEESGEKSRYWWVEELKDSCKGQKIKALRQEDLELITLYVFEQHTQNEIALIYGCSQQNIYKKLQRLKKL